MKIIKAFNDYLRQNMDLVGILDGQRAFVGPELVQIDVTNTCNNDCIGCWCRSPLLGERALSPTVEKQTLPLELVKKVVADCAEMGTTNIYLAGGGEPFTHPHIMEIIRHIKRLGLICHVNTNFTLVDKQRAEELVRLGVDHLIISLWAATPETYSRTHPNRSESTFRTLVDTIRHTVQRKGKDAPHIVLYNVIMNLNYMEIEDMVSLARELGVEAVEYTVIDVIPGYTDQLLLNSRQQDDAIKACQRIRPLMNGDSRIDNLQVRIEDFYQRVANPAAVDGDYDTEMLTEIPCVIGWNFTRILADGNVNACLKAHRMPVGNIYQKPFSEIWNSQKQRYFRRKALEGNKRDPFFSLIGNDESADIGCYRGCDDIERNRRLWRRLQQQSVLQRALLRGVGTFLKARAKIRHRS